MEYKEHYSNSSNNDIEREAQDIAGIVYDYEIIIKVFLVIILIYTFISNIFTISSELINDNLKLYAFISLMIILYVLYKLDIISLLKLLVILIFASFIAASIYYNLQKLEFIILFYYSFNYQLEKIYNETKTNYNEVLFSFIFIAIISIISIVLYWDNIYTDAKKLSKCGKIINTIENNNKNKKPFIYNIIIINNDLIDTTTSKYILKITYDFMKKKTIVDYGTDDGNYNDGSESFKKQGYISLYNKETNSLSELENDNEEKKNIEEKNRNRFQFQYNKAERIEKEAESYLDNFKKVEDAKILKSIEDKQADVNSAENAYAKAELEIYRIRKYCELASGVAQINEKIANARANKNAILIAQNRVDDRLKIIEDDYNFNREKNQENKDILTDIIGREESNDKEKLYYYFNLRTMKSEKIENIDANILTEERFKYILVDDNNNKLPYDETAQDLIKFTKIYSKNEKYNINIINDIFYAKNNREKLFI